MRKSLLIVLVCAGAAVLARETGAFGILKSAVAIPARAELGMPGKTEHIELPGHPVPAGIAFSSDGNTAYVAFSRTNTLAVIDAQTRQIRREIEIGMAPFGVAVSKERGRIFV